MTNKRHTRTLNGKRGNHTAEGVKCHRSASLTPLRRNNKQTVTRPKWEDVDLVDVLGIDERKYSTVEKDRLRDLLRRDGYM